MNTIAAVTRCAQTGCKVHEDGKCLEGLSIIETDADRCPHFFYNQETVNGTSTTKEKTSSTPPQVELFSGDELTLKNISFIKYRYRTNLVFIIGEQDCGKTTLLAELFDAFQRGKFGNYLFAGSVTQIGFEKRCHYARSASKNSKPDTERTKAKEFNFLHIAVKHEASIKKEATHLLISDISGERFKLARDSGSSMRELALIGIADHIVVILDGEMLADKRTKWATITRMQTFILKALDEKVFDGGTTIRIVISKWDKLDSIPNFSYNKDIKQPWKKLFSDRLKKIDFSEIASRPDPGNVKFELCHGLHDLLKLWVKPKQIPATFFPEVASVRYFDRYQFNDH